MSFQALSDVSFYVLSELTQKRFAERERAFNNLEVSPSIRRNNWGKSGWPRTESNQSEASRSIASGGRKAVSGSNVFRS